MDEADLREVERCRPLLAGDCPLEALRAEIASLRSRLDELVAEQKSFVSDLF